jgi:hypothetical protein
VPAPSGWLRQVRLRLRVAYTAARLRPLVVGVAITDGIVHPTTGNEIVLGERASVRNATIRSRVYICGNYVAVVNNIVDLSGERR